jgi:hypothetical protein
LPRRVVRREREATQRAEARVPRRRRAARAGGLRERLEPAKELQRERLPARLLQSDDERGQKRLPRRLERADRARASDGENPSRGRVVSRRRRRFGGDRGTGDLVRLVRQRRDAERRRESRLHREGDRVRDVRVAREPTRVSRFSVIIRSVVRATLARASPAAEPTAAREKTPDVGRRAVGPRLERGAHRGHDIVDARVRLRRRARLDDPRDDRDEVRERRRPALGVEVERSRERARVLRRRAKRLERRRAAPGRHLLLQARDEGG